METENALTIAKENSKENFFEEEARLWAEVYGRQSDKPDLESLQRMLENMNHLLLLRTSVGTLYSYLVPKFCPLYASSGRKYK